VHRRQQRGYLEPRRVYAIAEVNGVATFDISGAGRNTGGAAAFLGINAAQVLLTRGLYHYTFVGQAHVCTYDENGAVLARGVDALDLASFVADFNQRAPGNRPRSDFTHSGALDVLGLVKWVGVNHSGASRFGCGALCPWVPLTSPRPAHRGAGCLGEPS
jgi:hypothetical protein